ncbi:hypothetical protein WMW72_10720 [Paenibacillus filicis]|uniref:Uncharacterized protein n=1 Tax=Paenibacillus filicis TaxID=669464 RepID=A0ABU9DHM1_9BACL
MTKVRLKIGNQYTREMDEKEALLLASADAVKEFFGTVEIEYLEPKPPELKVIKGGANP